MAASDPRRNTSSNPLHVTVVRDFASLASHRQAWNALVSTNTTSTVFQTFEWHHAWWQTYATGREPLVLLARDDTELVAVAPLMVTAHRTPLGRIRTVEFIGRGMSDYCDFLTDPRYGEAIASFVSWLMDHAAEWEEIRLSDMPDTSVHFDLMRNVLGTSARPVLIRRLYEAPSWVFGNAAADAKLLRKKSMRRHFNYFTREGELEFVNLHTATDIAPHLEEFFRQHITRRATTDQPSLFLEQKNKDFYRALVDELTPKGWLLFSIMTFNSAPIAFHFGFRYNNTIIWYAPTFDVAYAKHSPGEVLLKFLFELAVDEGVGEFDFTIGEEDYKYRFSNQIRANHVIRLFQSPVRHRIVKMWVDSKERIAGLPMLAGPSRRLLRLFRRGGH